MMIELSQSCA